MAPPPWFRGLFDLHYAEVVRHLRYLLGDHAEAEDLAQETFLRLYLSSPAPPREPRGWLLRVATRLAYNHLRGQRRRRRREEEYARAEAGAADPEHVAATAGDVRRALARLEPRDRLLLLLRAAGYRYGELAELLDVAPSSVGTLLARARRRFARAWSEPAGQPSEREGGRAR